MHAECTGATVSPSRPSSRPIPSAARCAHARALWRLQLRASARARPHARCGRDSVTSCAAARAAYVRACVRTWLRIIIARMGARGCCVRRKRFTQAAHCRPSDPSGSSIARQRNRIAPRRGAGRSPERRCAQNARQALAWSPQPARDPVGLHPMPHAPGLGSPPPHLRRDWAHSYHICAGTRRAPAPAARARMRRAANAPRMRIAAAYADNRYRYCREGPDNAHLPLPPRRERQQCIAHHAVGGGGSGGCVSARCAACARRRMIEAQPPQIGRPMHEFDLRVRADSKPTWYGMRWAWRGARRCHADSAACGAADEHCPFGNVGQCSKRNEGTGDHRNDGDR